MVLLPCFVRDVQPAMLKNKRKLLRHALNKHNFGKLQNLNSFSLNLTGIYTMKRDQHMYYLIIDESLHAGKSLF